MWHKKHDVNLAIEKGLAKLAALGQVERVRSEEGDVAFVKQVAFWLAGAIATMPAVKLAMHVQYPGDDQAVNMQNVARVIGTLLGVDGEELVKHLAIGKPEEPPIFTGPADPNRN
jgi:NAD/NADP transhydrogenase alpha subunit